RRDRTEGAVVGEGNVEASDAETQASGGEGAAASEAVSGGAVTGDALGSETVRAATPTPVEPVMPVAEAAVPPAFTALELPPQPSAAQPVATAPRPSPEPVAPPASESESESESAVTPAPAAPVAAELAAYELPMNELAAVAEGSGLEWVNTDAQKVRQAQEAMANAPKPTPSPRAPKPVVELDDGPLVLVETRKDLSQVKLPFERH
nr:ribonuclease E/G [Methylibium sp.]